MPDKVMPHTYHINKLPDEYQIASDQTGNVEISISKRLSNAWYLVQACNMLLVRPAPKPKTTEVQ